MIELFLSDTIALAGPLRYAGVVEDSDTAAGVVDEPSPFEGVGRVRHACPSHPEHHCEKLLGEREIRRSHAILRHQKPAATPLFQKVKCVAGC